MGKAAGSVVFGRGFARFDEDVFRIDGGRADELVCEVGDAAGLADDEQDAGMLGELEALRRGVRVHRVGQMRPPRVPDRHRLPLLQWLQREPHCRPAREPPHLLL